MREDEPPSAWLSLQWAQTTWDPFDHELWRSDGGRQLRNTDDGRWENIDLLFQLVEIEDGVVE